jgi:hypothetical protein
MTLNSTIRHSLTAARVPVTYLIDADDMPVVYLRCDPRTYEVFTEEQYTLLPECPELGDDLKFGHAQNLNGREATYETNGVFVFALSLCSIDDARLLEAKLLTIYKACRREGTREYLSLPLLQEMMHELQAKAILDRVKAKIMELIDEMTFIHSLHVGVYRANSIRETRSGIAVGFEETEVACRGRIKDREHQALLKRMREQEEEKTQLTEENRVLGKRALEREQENETLLHEIAQLKKRLCLHDEAEVLGA